MWFACVGQPQSSSPTHLIDKIETRLLTSPCQVPIIESSGIDGGGVGETVVRSPTSPIAYQSRPFNTLMMASTSYSQPPPHHRPTAFTHSLQHAHLVRQTDEQRRQIIQNEKELITRETRIAQMKHAQRTSTAHTDATTQLNQLKMFVAQDDACLRRMRTARENIERDRDNEKSMNELNDLRRSFGTKEQQLREAVEKVDSLRLRIAQMHKERAGAKVLANKLLREQAIERKRQQLQTVDKRIDEVRTLMMTPPVVEHQRPKAAVEPFHFTPPGSTSPELDAVTPVKQASTSSIGYNTVLSVVGTALQKNTSPEALRQLAQAGGEDQTDRVQSSLPTTPTKVAPSVAVSISARPKQKQDANTTPPAPPPDVIPAQEANKLMQQHNDLMNDKPSVDGGVVDQFYNHLDSDKISIRNDTLRAAKRRSWATNDQQQSPTTQHEIDHIRAILKKEQMRGSRAVNLGSMYMSGVRPASVPGSVPTSTASAQPDNKMDATAIRPPPPYPVSSAEEDENAASSSMPLPPPPPEPDHPPPPYELVATRQSQQQQQIALHTVNSSDDSEVGGNESPTTSSSSLSPPQIVMMSNTPSPTSANLVGILKRDKGSSSGRRIRFDPLALLLDAALEGDMSLVVASAAQMHDVSRSNDEGITALHNAICAGHLDIVQFLVERGADVNACDSDGWTPLHCAASCNNLPMVSVLMFHRIIRFDQVRFLVDNGACVFATTLSDHETAADKCEQDEDGYESCSLYLLGTQEQMGCAALNSSRVYAAYDYDAQEQDEISVRLGESITVVNREHQGEKAWWLCTSTKGNTGFLPRNYLCLHPRRVVSSPVVSTGGEGTGANVEQHSPAAQSTSTDLDSLHSSVPSSSPELVDHMHHRLDSTTNLHSTIVTVE